MAYSTKRGRGRAVVGTSLFAYPGNLAAYPGNLAGPYAISTSETEAGDDETLPFGLSWGAFKRGLGWGAFKLRGFPVGPGSAASPASRCVGVTDRTARERTVRGLGAASTVGAAAGTAVLGPGVGTAVGSVIGGFIKSSAAKPNAQAAQAVWPLAQAGYLAAVQAFLSRASIQTVSSAAPWRAGADALRQNGDLMAQTAAAVAAGMIRPSWWELRPEDVLPTVRNYQLKYSNTPAPVVTGPSPIAVPTGGSIPTIVSDMVSGFLTTPAGQDVRGAAMQYGAGQALQTVKSNAAPLVIGAGIFAAIFALSRGIGRRRGL